MEVEGVAGRVSAQLLMEKSEDQDPHLEVSHVPFCHLSSLYQV